jgi:hypothetical protein
MAAPLTLQALATSRKGMRASSEIILRICLSRASKFSCAIDVFSSLRLQN